MRSFLRALLLLAVPAAAFAWSTEAEVRIAKKAAMLAPPDLRLLLEKYESDYLRGVRDAAEDTSESRHRERVAGRRGAIRTELAARVGSALRAVRTRQPMRDLVYELGLTAHIVADANNPLRVGENDFGPAVEADYEAYFSRKLGRFPTVFYGLRDEGEVQAVVNHAIARSRRFNALLEEEYHRDGRLRSSADFDDRSTAFGIASISYSRAVSDLVNVFYAVWKEAGGDVRTAQIMKKGNLLLNEDGR
ncbi:MAG TPA: hypothetical protein VGF40_02870 [Thermoanaerobaculia bacterium]